MLGVAGILGAEIARPDMFFYEAGMPQNLPEPFTNVNMGGLLAWQFCLMHFVEVRRWMDYKNFGSVNEVSCGGAGMGVAVQPAVLSAYQQVQVPASCSRQEHGRGRAAVHVIR
jgi:hypothetical protein